MGFKQLVENGVIKTNYNSARDDILNEFYIPVLEESVEYLRMTGTFSSSILALAARGIQALIENNGHMKLIVGAFISQEDVDSITRGIETPEEVITHFAYSDINSIDDIFIKDHTSALGWMIAKGNLEIKFALPIDAMGHPTGGVFHAKCGIFIDDNGDKLSFNGSDNESANAFKRNTERFKVFYEWEDSYRDFVMDDWYDFFHLWENHEPNVAVFDIPDAVKNELINIAPSSNLELKELICRLKDYSLQTRSKSRSPQLPIKKKALWPHQQKAIECWEQNGRIGILEMATGTGKTITAIEAIVRTQKQIGPLIVIISCPYDHLVKQWKESITAFNLGLDIIIADSSNLKWKDELKNKSLEIKRDNLLFGASKIRPVKGFIVLTTHDSLSSINIIDPIKDSKMKLMLVVDEVHGIGAEKRKLGLVSDYSFRLGLSATPKRWFDEEGTQSIFDYFDKSVYEFSLKDAINTINPDTNESYLTPYYYKPRFVELTQDEMEYYNNVCDKISRTFHAAKRNPNIEAYLESLYFERQRILNNAVGKYAELDNIINEEKKLKYCIIYCAEQSIRLQRNVKQIDLVQDILNKYNIKQHKFTGVEGTTPKPEYGNKSEREHLLNLFANGSYSALVAMKCLDEGVDVPPARLAVLMSSTGNPRQFIQRRGRLLRRYPGKKNATIYDIIVLPEIEKTSQDPDLRKIQKQIITKELVRFKEFAKDSINYLECLNLINKIEEAVNLGKSIKGTL